MSTVVLAGCGMSGSGEGPAARPANGTPSASTSVSASPSASSTSPSAGASSASSSPTPAPPGPGERLGLDAGWGPSPAELDQAARIVGRLPLPALAGQTIVARYSGTAAPTRMVNRLHLGGVIVFDENVASVAGVRDANAALRAGVTRDWPVWISVDQEGGVVERIRGEATRFPTFMSAGAADDENLTRTAYAASGAELRGLGFNVDFAPDGDVTMGPTDPTIGSRSAGSFPKLVARQMTAAAEGYRSAGVVPVIKHFPGHGSVPTDSHLSMPVQRKSLRDLRRTDLLPFERGTRAGISAVMVSHIALRAVDPGVPATVSRPVVTGLLRGDLGFHGLVVTDALNMGAITRSHDSADAAVQALRAGVDVLLMPPDPAAARAGIVDAVRAGRLDRRRVEQAAARQIALLLHERATERQGLPVGSAAKASWRLSRGAVTVVAGPCTGRLVGRSVTPLGSPSTVAAFSDAARRAGLGLGGGTTVAFSGYGGGPVRADVAVTTDTPYALGASAAGVKIASYGDTPGAMRALVDVLLGRAPATGHLPVRVAGVERTGCPAPKGQ